MAGGSEFACMISCLDPRIGRDCTITGMRGCHWFACLSLGLGGLLCFSDCTLNTKKSDGTERRSLSYCGTLLKMLA